MTRYLLSVLALFMLITASAQQAEFFTPYKSIDLRLPSVPLILNDPYFSFWSPYDRLTDGNTKHWTNATKAMDGVLRVDGKAYRFMGKQKDAVLKSIVKMAKEQTWSAPAWFNKIDGDDWASPTFDDSEWPVVEGAIGTGKEYSYVHTEWNEPNSDVYVRRTANLTAADLQKDLYIVFSHDDVFELFINGTRVIQTGETWIQGEKHHLTDAEKALLKPGNNMIAAHCHNTSGGAYVDFGIFENLKTEYLNETVAEQLSCDVLATNTYYTFRCGPVDLDVVFTAPMIIDDLDLLSTPINYISYQVRANDGQQHNVQFYFATTPELALNSDTQRTISTSLTESGVNYVRTGTTEQKVLGRAGDMICIDWGYLYLPAINGSVATANYITTEQTFVQTGQLPATQNNLYSNSETEYPALAYVHDFGNVTTARNFMLIGYDEIQDIRYFRKDYKGYWARDGKTIFQAFKEMADNYDDIMTRCRQQDKVIYDDGFKSGGKKYAELLCASYRQVIAAHKLFQDDKGNILFFSKENNSNGCVNTVDLTYPSAPLFLKYNPTLQKGMMISIFDYSYSYGWNRPFAAHDLGTYPHANGQVYGGDMPLEESGNMLTLAATICMKENSTEWVDKYWNIMTTWVNYLVENGQDPAEQLCTDDFAGHWAHNANLSVKAIMGIAGYALMAKIKGEEDTYQNYMNIARRMARQWESDAREGDHYRLAFDRQNTWGQKYNLVWDRLWNIHIFPQGTIEREMSYYLTKQNRYGLPLDSRKLYTKSDWIMWSAAMADDQATFERFLNPLYDYVNETRSRVPLSDWYYTDGGDMCAFRARSVIGGHWMRILMDDMYNPEAAPSPEWAKLPNALNTQWADDVTPEKTLEEYPRPLMQRDEWLNLNGLWNYKLTTNSQDVPSDFDGQVLVPYALESTLSGFGRSIGDKQVIWYQREFTLPESWNGKTVIANFGAADYIAYIYINGRSIRRHTGGFTSFSCDITRYLKEGVNTILVKVEDPTDETKQLVGAQRKVYGANNSKLHSPASGIWQTVWLEPVNSKYISNLRITPDLDSHKFIVNATTAGTTAADMVKIVVKLDGDIVAQATAASGSDIALSIPSPKLWTPDSPTLYDVEATLLSADEEVDAVKSYAAMRKVSIGQDQDGIYRIRLNNRDLFNIGVLDYGYWPDGIYTAPTDEAMKADIQKAKDFGFNAIRKFQKVEPQRWYYYCDKLGMLVWQDIPSVAAETEKLQLNQWYTGSEGELARSVNNQYNNELTEIVNQLYSHPSIVAWTIFNEAVGQHTTAQIVDNIRALDATRLINPASGGNHYEGVGDMLSIHVANTPSISFYDETRPTILGIYGNLIYNVEGHRWNPLYTTTTYSSSTALGATVNRHNRMVLNIANPDNRNRGVSAAFFRQLTDVEAEVYGLMTYDRMPKVADANIKESITALAKAFDTHTGIETMHNEESIMHNDPAVYDLQGRKVADNSSSLISLPSSQKGIYIVRTADGTAKKILVK